MRELNEIEKGDLCQSAIELFYGTKGGLTNLPGILKNIIRYRAWESRVTNGRVVELGSLKELITEPPVKGWGETIKAVEAVISDDIEALTMFRGEIAGSRGGNNNPAGLGGKSGKVEGDIVNSNNITIDNKAKPARGTSKAYTASRLAKDHPELHEQVKANKLSLNEAAIQAGFRKETFTAPRDIPSLIRTLKKRLSADEISELIEGLSGNRE